MTVDQLVEAAKRLQPDLTEYGGVIIETQEDGSPVFTTPEHFEKVIRLLGEKLSVEERIAYLRDLSEIAAHHKTNGGNTEGENR